MSELERRLTFYPSGPPSPHANTPMLPFPAMEIEFVVSGAHGAVAFRVDTGWVSNRDVPNRWPVETIGQPYGKHLTSHRPAFGDMEEGEVYYPACPIRGTACYSRSLNDPYGVREVFQTLVRRGSDGVWEILEAYYRFALVPAKGGENDG